MKKTLLLISLSAMVSGCSTGIFSSKKVDPPPQEDPFKTEMLSVARSVDKSLKELSEIEQATRLKRHVLVADASGKVSDKRLLQMVSMSGDISNFESLIKDMANTAGYQFDVQGTRPLAPLTVSIPHGHYPLVNVLQDAGMQVGKLAVIMIKPDLDGGTIELNYPDIRGEY